MVDNAAIYIIILQGRSVSDVGHAVDVSLKIADFASFVRITPVMVVLAKKSNAVYAGNVLNYNKVHP